MPKRKPIDPLLPLLPSLPDMQKFIEDTGFSTEVILRHHKIVYLIEILCCYRDYGITPCVIYNEPGIRFNARHSYGGKLVFDDELVRSQQSHNTIEEAIEAGRKLVDRLYEQPKF